MLLQSFFVMLHLLVDSTVVAADPLDHSFVLEKLGEDDRLVVVEPESLGFVCAL